MRGALRRLRGEARAGAMTRGRSSCGVDGRFPQAEGVGDQAVAVIDAEAAIFAAMDFPCTEAI